MTCANENCQAPFALDSAVPRDRLCADCRGYRDYLNPMLELEL
jgi:hypothetical protein